MKELGDYMKSFFKKYKIFIITGVLLLFSLIFTILLITVDVTNKGVLGTKIGFTSFNLWFNKYSQYDGVLYNVSKILGFLPFGLVLLYAALGIYELVKRKSLKKVDHELYALLAAYLLMAIVYIVFEKLELNYRPVLEDGKIAASFPSSHTLFSIVICGTAFIFNFHLFKEKIFIKEDFHLFIINSAITFVGLVIVITRTFSGVHWISDIIAGILFGASIVGIYESINKTIQLLKDKKNKNTLTKKGL